MGSSYGGVGTVVVASAIATCGLLMLGGVGPSADGTPIPAVAPPSTSDAATTTTTTTTIPTPTSSTTRSTSTTSTTTSTSTTVVASATTTTTTTTIVPATTLPPTSPVPDSIIASDTVVGAGGTITFDGTCATNGGAPIGAIIVWVIREGRDGVEVIDTGLSSTSWTFNWTAPTDEADFGSVTFQFWCGDPSGFEAGYPLGLQQRVDMVASAAPPSTPVVESAPPAPVIPETD